jgi:hypothetical protein
MARGGHGLPKVSLRLAMPYPLRPMVALWSPYGRPMVKKFMVFPTKIFFCNTSVSSLDRSWQRRVRGLTG